MASAIKAKEGAIAKLQDAKAEAESLRDRYAKDAERMQGVELWAEPLDDPDALWVHELIGCSVMDGGVERGTVVAVRANPASDLLELDSGALVPVTFVVGPPSLSADGSRLLAVDVPAGLFDL